MLIFGALQSNDTISTLKAVATAALILLSPTEQAVFSRRPKTCLGFMAGAAGFMIAGPTMHQLAYYLLAKPTIELSPPTLVTVSAVPVPTKAKPQATRTRSTVKPTQTVSRSSGSIFHVLFALLTCVLVTIGTVSMVLGRGASFSRPREQGGQHSPSQDSLSTGEVTAKDVDGQSPASGGAIDAPSSKRNKKSSKAARKNLRQRNGTPPPSSPPSETIACADDGKNGPRLFGFYWSVLCVALAAAFEWFRVQRAKFENNLNAEPNQRHASAPVPNLIVTDMNASYCWDCARNTAPSHSRFNYLSKDIPTRRYKTGELLLVILIPDNLRSCLNQSYTSTGSLDTISAQIDNQISPVTSDSSISTQEVQTHTNDDTDGHYWEKTMDFIKALSINTTAIAFLFCCWDRVKVLYTNFTQLWLAGATKKQEAVNGEAESPILAQSDSVTDIDASTTDPSDFATATAPSTASSYEVEVKTDEITLVHVQEVPAEDAVAVTIDEIIAATITPPMGEQVATSPILPPKSSPSNIPQSPSQPAIIPSPLLAAAVIPAPTSAIPVFEDVKSRRHRRSGRSRA